MPYRVTRAPWLGVPLTVAMLAATELARDSGIASLVSVTLLILTLVPVAYSALAGGFAPGFVSAGLVALYTLHYTSAGFFTPTGEVFSGGVVMLVIGVGTVIPMALLRRREQRLVAALQARATDLAERNAELTEANAALEAFGFVVSHDLKEPVRAIENYLEVVKEEYRGSDDGRKLLSDAYTANQRLYRLLEGLLAYSRTSTSPTTQRAHTVRAIIESDACRLQYEPAVKEKGATLQIDPALPTVLGDEVILAQVFGNLILNAARHNRSAHPEIHITSSDENARESMAHLVVEDNGPGFPRDLLARFSQLKSSRPATLKGGFGLVIAHRAVHRSGGTMAIDNRTDGSGARVHVFLPAAPADDNAP